MPTSPRAPQALTPNERAFLQLRVSRFGLVAALVFGGFWLLRVSQFALAGPEGTPWASGYLDSSMRYHLLATMCLAGVWGATVRGAPGVATIRVIEIVGLVLTTVAVSLMALELPLAGRPDYVLLLALGGAMTIRGIYVPSSWQRSFALSSLVGLIALVAIYVMWLKLDIESWSHVQPQMASYTPRDSAVAMVFNGIAWWGVITVQATASSHVIYGLRRDVRTAKQLGQYQLETKLGEGGMGMVFRAQHSLLRRPTAVKLLLPEKAGERAIDRFEREVRLMSRLRHPNTITIFDYGRSPDGVFYYAMELVDGATLADIVKLCGPMEPARALLVIWQCAAAMNEAHGIGLIHRDIKPANIMVYLPHQHGGIQEAVKVLDFGLVKEIESQDAEITVAGRLCGTPHYMSPEAITDPDTVDGRSDIYALGAVLFYLLTGEHLFKGNAMEVCAKQLTQAPDTLHDRLGQPVATELEKVVADCLMKDRDQRISSALELQERLAQCPGFGEFSNHDASEWWAEYGELFAEASEPAEGLLTMDLERALSSSS